MRTNYDSQTGNYGGALTFPTTASFSFGMTIPLYISASDIPVRKPKITLVNTLPTQDEAGVSDWATHAVFYGGQGLLTTQISGFFLNPYITVTGINNQKFWQYDPTVDGSQGGTSVGLTGYSYGEVIWMFLNGRLNNPSSSIFTRTDPSSYTDTFGNVYSTVVIQQFDCEYTSSLIKQTFNMTLYLEV